METLPVLETENLVLRPIGPEDARDLLAIFGDPRVMRYWSSPAFEGLEDARRLIEEIAWGLEDCDLLECGVTVRGRDRVVGTCTLHRIDREHKRAEIGYSLAREAWGRGLMTEALSALIRHAFRDLDLHRLEADVDPRNDPSIRLLERLGFRREGLLRERYRVNGEVQDSLMFGLLRREAPPELRGDKGGP